MGILVDAEIVRKHGANSAILFGQIRYWFEVANKGKTRRTVQRGGEAWVALSRNNLAEQTGLSPKQVETTLSTLKKARLIESERGLYENKVTPHFRVITSPQTGATDYPQTGAIIYNKTDLKNELSAVPPADAQLCAVSNTEDEETDTVKKQPISVADVLKGARVSSPIEKKTPSQVKKAGDLAETFKQAWVDQYPDEYLGPFTAKQLGQFSLLLKRSPQGKAGMVLDFAVRNWSTFTSLAQQREGAINPPTRPEIGVLLRFVGTAVVLLEGQSQPTAAKPKPKAPPKAPPVVVQKPQLEEKVEDLDEVWKLLKLGQDDGSDST